MATTIHRAADEAMSQAQHGHDDTNKDDKKDFELDACQINELKGSIVTKHFGEEKGDKMV